MNFTNNDMIKKLQGFGELERRKTQLAFELEHYIDKISSDDVIESMTFKSSLGEHISGGKVSDITAGIAASYRDKVERMNIRDKQELLDELKQVELEIMRLKFYVGLLDARQANVIQLHYFEGCTLIKTAETLDISVVTVKRTLKTAVGELTRMFDLIIS